MRTYKHLYEQFLTDKNIMKAIHTASQGSKKKKRRDAQEALTDIDKFVKEIKEYVQNFTPCKHTPKVIYDGVSRKQRVIIVPTFKELVIQHMIINVLEDMFLKGVYETAYGSVPKRGAFDGKRTMQRWVKRDPGNCKYVIKLDIKKYFENIPHDILKQKLARKIKDDRILKILFAIIDTTDKGLPLGFYTSQWLAMWYLQDFDHYVKQHLYSPHYMRYMDDMVILGGNKRKLRKTYEAIIKELDKLGLKLNSKRQLFRFDYMRDGKRCGRDIDFMGFRFFRDRTILRKSIFLKILRKVKRMNKKLKPTIHDCRQMMSYLGWLKHTDSYYAWSTFVAPYFNSKKARKRISNYDRRIRLCMNGIGVNPAISLTC